MGTCNMGVRVVLTPWGYCENWDNTNKALRIIVGLQKINNYWCYYKIVSYPNKELIRTKINENFKLSGDSQRRGGRKVSLQRISPSKEALIFPQFPSYGQHITADVNQSNQCLWFSTIMWCWGYWRIISVLQVLKHLQCSKICQTLWF